MRFLRLSPEPINLIVAPTGQGKGLLFAYLCYLATDDAARRGWLDVWHLFTNFQLKSFLRPFHVFTPALELDAVERIPREKRKGIIGWDEASRTSNSRRSMSLQNELQIDLIIDARKRGVPIYSTIQLDSMQDKDILGNAGRIYWPQTIRKLPRDDLGHALPLHINVEVTDGMGRELGSFPIGGGTTKAQLLQSAKLMLMIGSLYDTDEAIPRPSFEEVRRLAVKRGLRAPESDEEEELAGEKKSLDLFRGRVRDTSGRFLKRV